MNTWTKWYGAVGLISMIGKNSFAVGQKASELSKSTCHYIRTDIIEIDVAVIGKVFEKLENTFEGIAKSDKWTSAENWCQEWETWAEQKYEQARVQEELNEDWRDNVNDKVPTLKKIVGEKLLSAKEKTVKGLQKIEEKYFPRTKLETPEKATYRPNCLRFVGIY